MSKPTTIRIDDQEYIRADQARQWQHDGDLKIVILQRGWVMVGRMERNGEECRLHNAAVIRKWGTSDGLPELATKGPRAGTILDRCSGVVEFHYLTVIATLSCDEAKWDL